MNEYQLYIDGDFCEASDGNRFESVNPATGEVWTTAPAATEADVDRVIGVFTELQPEVRADRSVSGEQT